MMKPVLAVCSAGTAAGAVWFMGGFRAERWGDCNVIMALGQRKEDR
jgi:protein tyrosine phosphatase (PTP) superfamily phosphohydrolase (DUF442 family)